MKQQGREIKEQSMAKGFAVLSIASIAVKVLSLFFIPVIRKLMGGSAGYQVYYSANQVFAFVYVLATAGLPVAISKMVTEQFSNGRPEAAKQAFRVARRVMAGIGLGLTVLLMLLSKPLAAATGYPESWLGILVIAPNIFLCSVLSAYRGYLQGMKNMTPTAYSQIAEQCIHLLVAITAVLLVRRKGLVLMCAAASTGTVAGSLIALAVVLYYYKRQDAEKTENAGRQIDAEENRDFLQLLIHYSVPITLSSAIQYGGNMIDVFIVKGRLLAAGLSEKTAGSLHGDLSTARQLINVPTALVTALCISLLPIIAGLYAQKKYTDASERANYAFKLCFIAAVPCAVAMCVFADPIYQLLGFGSQYKILMYMSLSVLLLGVTHLQMSIMQSVNLLYYATAFMGVSVAVKALLNFILIGIPGLNIYGAILSTYISYLIPLFLNAYVLKKERGIRIDLLKPFAAPMTASAAMLVPSVPVYLLFNGLLGRISSYFGNLFAFGLAACVAVAVYFIVLKALNGIDKSDVDSISPKLSRILRL